MKKKVVIWSCKIISAIIAFIVTFMVFQAIFVPKYTRDSTDMVDGFYKLEDNSVDVLFLGASQMFCTVDSQKLTETYGISSYDFGASSQQFSGNKYYLTEALKMQTPKLIMVEVAQFRYVRSNIGDGAIAYTYVPMPLTNDKIDSLNYVFYGNVQKVVEYYLPLLHFHSRWNSLGAFDIKYYFRTVDNSCRGYYGRDYVQEYEIAYKAESEGPLINLPEENKNLLTEMANMCSQKGIEIIFFKSPSASWTRNNSKVIKEFCAEKGYSFVDFNDHLDEIGIDNKTDLYDAYHLNASGAEKTTDYMANYLKTVCNL